jgi:small subunit ribosomal protein S17
VSERKAQPGSPKAGAAKTAKAATGKAEAAKAKAPAPPEPAPKAPAKKEVAPKARPPAAVKAKPEGQASPEGAAEAEKKSFKRTLIGRVKSDKMNKTVVVEVIRSKMDPVYKKYVRVRKSYQAHDEENSFKIGDRVEIIEHRPLSRMKRWKVINLVERAVQE